MDLGIEAPGDIERTEQLGNLPGARAVRCKGVVVKEDLPDLREIFFNQLDLFEHVLGASHPVGVSTDRLRPKTESTARRAPAPGINGNIGMEHPGNLIVQDLEIPLVDLGDKGKRIEVVDDFPIRVMEDFSIPPVADPRHLVPIAAFRDFLDRIVELPSNDQIDTRRGLETLLGKNTDMRTNEGDLGSGPLSFDQLGGSDIVLK